MYVKDKNDSLSMQILWQEGVKAFDHRAAEDTVPQKAQGANACLGKDGLRGQHGRKHRTTQRPFDRGCAIHLECKG